MENTILIETLKVYAQATQEQVIQYLEELLKTDRKEMLLFPDPTDPMRYIAMLLEKYYTPELTESFSVRGTERTDAFRSIYLSRTSVRSYIFTLMRKFNPSQSNHTDNLAEQLLGEEVTENKEKRSIPFMNGKPLTAIQFLTTKTPSQIEAELNAQIMAQPELTKVVADFLYYHVLRQLHPDLPQRPLMIYGPSGNGKTEVWRAAERLYGNLFPIRIIDGSGISCDGWAGNFKLSHYIDETISKGGILVVDEFDKLVKPRHNSKGDNVSLDVQAEFLKLLEGEYSIRKDKGNLELTSKKMGFVLVGAFEGLREEKMRQRADAPHIGFCQEKNKRSEETVDTLTDEDFIRYGIMPEIVGRIASKCGVAELDEMAYLQILRNPNSRVAQIEKVLKLYGVQITDVLTEEELRKLILTSKSNRTGVRWVSAQVEARLLEAIRQNGLQLTQANVS